MDAANFVNQQKLKNSFFTIDINPYLQTEDDEEEEMEDSFDINLFTDSNLVGKKEDEPSQKSATSGSNAENQNLAKLFDKNPLFFSQLGLASSSSSSSSSDFISRRKILPFEPISKLQSPMAILQSSPNVATFSFRRQKSVVAKKMEERESKKSQKPEAKQKTEKEYSFRFYRKSSVRRRTEESLQQPLKRFPKEAINKYLKLIKRFYMEVSKIYSEKESLVQDPYPVSSPANKHFGKSKSWSRANNLSLPAFERMDDSLLLHSEGIQSAIWHCKKSFDSSRDSSSSSSSSTFFGDHSALPTNQYARDFSGLRMMDIARTT